MNTHPHDVHVPGVHPIVGAQLHERFDADRGTCVVEEHVDASEAVNCRRNRSSDLILIGDIESESDSASTQSLDFGNDLVQAAIVLGHCWQIADARTRPGEIADDYVGAGLGHLECGRPPDPTRSARPRNECDLSVKWQLVHGSSF